jgi:hypothetical protein
MEEVARLGEAKRTPRAELPVEDEAPAEGRAFSGDVHPRRGDDAAFALGRADRAAPGPEAAVADDLPDEGEALGDRLERARRDRRGLGAWIATSGISEGSGTNAASGSSNAAARAWRSAASTSTSSWRRSRAPRLTVPSSQTIR